MKLQDMEVIVTAPPAPGWGGRYWILVKLTTDTGIVGWGECYASSIGPDAMTAVIEDVFSRHMQGANPEDIELMFRRVYSSGFTQRPDLTVMGAWSGLEIACWDILGKDRDRPVYALLGGRMNDRIRAYTYLYPQPQHNRDTVGDKADLLFGTHGQFSTAGAIRLGQALEPYSPLWFEEPIPPDNVAEMAKVADAVRIPVATGERLTTKAEFAEVLRQGAATILQPALGRAGGIWEMKKVAAIAEVYNAQMAPHLYAGPVEWAANVHLAASIPNILMAETIETPFHAALIKNSIAVENGFITPPSAAGLGIEVDEDLARAHPYTGSGLHLEMQEDPCDYANGNAFQGGAPASDP